MRLPSLPGLACVLVVAAGCGKPTLASLCRDGAAVTCDKLFECTPAQASQLGYTSAADCAAKRNAQASCAQFDTITCDGTDLGGYQRCLDDLRAMPCSATTQPASCQGLGTPSCTSNDGKVLCSGSGSSAGTGCSTSRSGCNDGHTYELSCDNGSCQCRVDDAVTKTYSGGGCPSASAELNTACGWNLR